MTSTLAVNADGTLPYTRDARGKPVIQQAIIDAIVNAIGGGSISATDGTTTVNPATSIQFPAGTLTNLGSGVAGVGLVLSRIGPFPFAFNSPEITNNGFILAALAAGTQIITSWIEVSTAFNGGAPNASIAVGDPDTGGDNIATCLVDNSTELTTAIGGAFALGDTLGHLTANLPRVIRTTEDCSLFVALSANGAITQGAANIYAIVASPAS